MNIKSRTFKKNKDYKKIIKFLENLYKENSKTNWIPQRFEYGYYFGISFESFRLNNYYDWESLIRIWENEDDEVIGFVTPEGSQGDFFIQVDRNYEFLEEEMVDWIESNIPQEIKKYGSNKVRIWCNKNHEGRVNLLENKGFKRLDWNAQIMIRNLDKSLQEVKLYDGYVIKTVNEEGLYKKCQLAGQAFEYEPYSVGVYKDMQSAPMYRKELDLVAVDKNDNYAAFCTVWFNKELEIGLFEPVGTHPEYRKKGLSKALIYEGLKRLKELGAKQAQVGSYDEPAHRLYNSCGFHKYQLEYPFEKEY